MSPPKLSDLYTARQIARKWYRSLIGLAVLNALAGSQLFTTRSAWGDPVAWVQFVVCAGIACFLVDKAVTTEDYREMKPIDPRLIPNGGEPQP